MHRTRPVLEKKPRQHQSGGIAALTGATALLCGGIAAGLAGNPLGVWFAAVVFAGVMTPPLALWHEAMSSRNAMLLCLAIVAGLIAPPAVLPGRGQVGSIELLSGAALMLVWVCLLFMLAHLLERAGSEPTLSAALVTALALAWLTAPIWLPDRAAAAVVHAHPLFAINSVLVDRCGLWTERPIAYRYLFALGQDVPYTLPRTIWPMILLHGGLALGAGTLLSLTNRRAR